MINEEETTVTTGVQASGEAHGKAFGKPYFNCDSKTFDNCLKGRKPRKHWKNFTANLELSDNIRAFLKKNPKQKSVLLRKDGSEHFISANKLFF